MRSRGYNCNACNIGTRLDGFACCTRSLRRRRMLMVPDSLNQAATKALGDTNLPMLKRSTWNGAPIERSNASMTRRRVLEPAILLCFPQPVRMLQRQKKTWCQFRKSQEILSYSSRFAQPRIKYLKNSGIARPSKTIERTFRSHACTIAWAAPHDIRCRSKQKSPHVFSQTWRFTPSSTTCWAPCLWKWPGTEV
jgi:hypothetical protein